MAERPEQDEIEREREETTDLGYRDTDEERAYERAEPGDRPPTSSEPEPDAEPPDAG